MRNIKSALLLFVILLFFSYRPAYGQYRFGRNKIQYSHFNWQILKTEHFDIYYYPEMESLAKTGAYFAEESYSKLQDKMNHTILNRIPLIFYSSHFHFEETNVLPYLIPDGVGGFFEFIKGRVVVPCDGSVDRFRQTIHHELVHVFQVSYVKRILQEHRVLKSKSMPLWFTEGLADYWAENWSSEAEMVIRDMVLHNTIVPIQNMSRIWGTFLMYKEGQSIIRYISNRYGEDKILRLMDNFWKGKNFSEVMEITIGKDYKALSEEWIYDLRKNMYPLMLEGDIPSMVSLRITNKGFNTMPAFYRKNGVPMVIFLANRDGYSSIYQKPIADYKKAKPKIVIRGERTSDLESFRLQKSGLDVDSLGRLVFVAKRGPSDILYIYDLHSKRVIQDLVFERLVSIFSPSWSPDGQHIAFSGLDWSGRHDLYIVRIEDKHIRRLTDDFFDDRDPSWSPSGDGLIFSSDRTDAGEGEYTNLFYFDLKRNSIDHVTFGPYQDTSPTWSSDGRMIAFSSDRDGVPNIWSIELSRSEEDRDSFVFFPYKKETMNIIKPKIKQVTRFTTGAFYPCWTDSLALLVTGFENLGLQIRGLNDIEDKLKQIESIQPDTLVEKKFVREYPRIVGDIETTRTKYKKKFNLDFAQSVVSQDPIFGTSGGGQLGISDMLGNEQYYFLLYNNARTRSEFWDGMNVAVTRIDLSRRINYSTGLYRLAGRYYNGYTSYFYEERIGGFGSLSYPLNKFERIETSINMRYSEKDLYNGRLPRKAVLLSNFISYVKDNSLWGPTGPLDGARYNITLGNTIDMKYDNVNFTTVMFDLRRYFRISYRMCYAVRLWGQFNQGKEPLPFVMGGSWSLRGYRLWSLWGPKLAFISNEIRFPFIDRLYFGFPFGGIGFTSIQGALFVDAGNVWDDRFEDIKGSLGFGLRLRLGGYLVLRLDVGRKTDFKNIRKNTFTQFFFGWDF